MRKRYRLLNHSSDLYIESYGENRKEKIENMLKAFVTEVFKCGANILEREYVFSSEYFDILVVELFNDLISISERENIYYCDINVLDFKEKKSLYEIRVKVYYSYKGKYELRVKAASYGMFYEDDKRLRLLFDL